MEPYVCSQQLSAVQGGWCRHLIHFKVMPNHSKPLSATVEGASRRVPAGIDLFLVVFAFWGKLLQYVIENGTTDWSMLKSGESSG